MSSFDKPWKKLRSTLILDNPWYRVRKDAVQLPNGTIIDDNNLDTNGITINSMKLFPDFVTTEAAVERMLGVVLQRPTTQAVPVPSFKLPELADNLPVAA